MPLVGGCAGDGMKMERTFQIHGDEVLSGGVVARRDRLRRADRDRLEPRLGARRRADAGHPLAGNRVDRDRRPARRSTSTSSRLGAPAEVGADSQAFTRWARTHPLGLGRRPNGHEPVRCVSEADFDERSIVCTAEVPAGGLAWFMHGDGDSVLRSTASACERRDRGARRRASRSG